jgi:nitrogen regulatory protein PII
LIELVIDEHLVDDAIKTITETSRIGEIGDVQTDRAGLKP